MGRIGMYPPLPVMLAAGVLASPRTLDAQSAASAGPVIQDFGPVYDIPDPDFAAARDEVLRVVFPLDDFGVELLLCGQSQSSRGIRKDQLAGPVRQALSAMTALVDLQARGYQLIAF